MALSLCILRPTPPLRRLSAKPTAWCGVDATPVAPRRARRDGRDVLKPDAKLPTHPAFRKGTLQEWSRVRHPAEREPSGRDGSRPTSRSSLVGQRERGPARHRPLVEHVAYMGSEDRNGSSAREAQTNAYTDFDHTVFYALLSG